MKEQVWDKIWRGSMGVALPVVFISAVMDRTLIETILRLWDDPTPWRLLFFVSSAFLLVGLARNSARLRRLVEDQPADPLAEIEIPRRARTT